MSIKVPVKLNFQEQSILYCTIQKDYLMQECLGVPPTDELVFDIDLQNAERAAYITPKEIAM